MPDPLLVTDWVLAYFMTSKPKIASPHLLTYTC